MMLKDTDIRKYVPLQTSNFDFSNYEGFELRAFRSHFPRFLGDELVEALLTEDPDSLINPEASGFGGIEPGSLSPADKLIERIIPALANLAVLESIPFLDVVLTSTGFGVVQNNNIAPASRERVINFAAGCRKAADDFMDFLLAFLEKNVDLYPTWNKCSLNPGTLLPDTETFNHVTKMNLKRFQFVELIPAIHLQVETVFSQKLSPQFLDEITKGDDKIVKPLLQRALAFHGFASLFSETEINEFTLYSNRSAQVFNRAVSVLKSNLSNYPVYSRYGYEKPYDNAMDGTSGFFIAGAH